MLQTRPVCSHPLPAFPSNTALLTLMRVVLPSYNVWDISLRSLLVLFRIPASSTPFPPPLLDLMGGMIVVLRPSSCMHRRLSRVGTCYGQHAYPAIKMVGKWQSMRETVPNTIENVTEVFHLYYFMLPKKGFTATCDVWPEQPPVLRGAFLFSFCKASSPPSTENETQPAQHKLRAGRENTQARPTHFLVYFEVYHAWQHISLDFEIKSEEEKYETNER